MAALGIFGAFLKLVICVDGQTLPCNLPSMYPDGCDGVLGFHGIQR